MKKDIVAAFDFDGTITSKDTFIEFAKHSVGMPKLLRGIIKSLPWLVLWKLHLCDGGVAKQHMFSILYKGMAYSDFLQHCENFAPLLDNITRKRIAERLDWHISSGHKTYIISASIPEWIIPWARKHGIPAYNILGTNIAIDHDSQITGTFSTPNCNGQEKVRRLSMAEANWGNCILYAYGNSAGDRPMLDIADFGTMVSKHCL